MDIRRATVEDAAAINRIARRSWESDYPGIVSRETVTDTVEEWYDTEGVAQEVDRPDVVLLVAETDDVIGFVHGIWDRDDGHILRLYVDPDHRREHVGSELLERAVDELTDRSVERVKATVLADNDLGNQFYSERGFERVDTAETRIGDELYPEHVYVRPVGE